MKIYNRADLMELSKRDVILPMKQPRHDLVSIHFEKEKHCVKNPANVVGKRDTIKEEGKEKNGVWKGYFFKELQLRSEIMWCTRRQWIWYSTFL